MDGEKIVAFKDLILRLASKSISTAKANFIEMGLLTRLANFALEVVETNSGLLMEEVMKQCLPGFVWNFGA